MNILNGGAMVVRIILAVLFFIFIFGTLFAIPLWMLGNALFALIGRPFGIRWKRVRTEYRDYEWKTDVPDRIAQSDVQAMRYAVYTVKGKEYKSPILSEKGEAGSVIYVLRKNPQIIWMPAYESRFSAFIAVVLIGGLFAGYVMAGIVVANAAMS